MWICAAPPEVFCATNASSSPLGESARFEPGAPATASDASAPISVLRRTADGATFLNHGDHITTAAASATAAAAITTQGNA